MKTGVRLRSATLLFFIFMVSCTVSSDVSTGGGGVFIPTGTTTAPVLLKIFLTPNPAPRGSTVAFHVTFTFSDSDGDLEGGTLTYRRQGATGIPISIPTLANQTSGQSPVLFFTETLTLTAGTVFFDFVLTDRAGNHSNVYSFPLTQT